MKASTTHARSMQIESVEPRRLLTAPVPTLISAVIVPDFYTGAVAYARLTWQDVSGESGYLVERSRDNVNWATSPVGPVGTDITSIQDPIDAGQNYYYRVRSLDGNAQSAPSNVQRPLTTADISVELSAVVQNSPQKITLSWPSVGLSPGQTITGYRVWKKARSATSWGSPQTIPGTSLGYEDTGVLPGGSYEYKVERRINNATPFTGQVGYITATIAGSIQESRGTTLLVVDETQREALSHELKQLRRDLIGDGWRVREIEVPRDDDDPNIRHNVIEVKSLIEEQYIDAQDLRSILLIGHVPVPYSGNTAWDGHVGSDFGNHEGAWVADSYYGQLSADLQSQWGDIVVNNTHPAASGSQYLKNVNVPNDGKFDADFIPGSLDVAVGRIDFANLPGHPEQSATSGFPSETALLRQYLERDHAWRKGQISTTNGALVDDQLGYYAGASSRTAWENFAPLVGADGIDNEDWYSRLVQGSDSYLWAAGFGFGFTVPENSIDAGVIDINSIAAAQHSSAVFNMLLGSYFGDWDKSNNLMRALLAGRGNALTVIWTDENPAWYFHGMAIGETIGESEVLSQNTANGTVYYQSSLNAAHTAHMSLLGDPTLRMNNVLPVSDVSAEEADGTVTLTWSSSTDATDGYRIYQSDSSEGPFEYVASAVGTSTSFSVDAAKRYYMVRAVKLEQTPSGTYYNLSTGVFSPPLVLSAELDYEHAPLSVKVQFSQDVADSLDVEDFSLIMVDRETTIDSSNLAVSFNSTTNVATVTFPGFAGGILDNANWQLVVNAAGIGNANDVAVTDDFPFDFFFLNGDTNRDRKVDIVDLGVVAGHWQFSNVTWADGDFNDDNLVNIVDLGIIASNWQAEVPAPGGGGGSMFARGPGGSESLAGDDDHDLIEQARQLILDHYDRNDSEWQIIQDLFAPIEA